MPEQIQNDNQQLCDKASVVLEGKDLYLPIQAGVNRQFLVVTQLRALLIVINGD